MEKKFVKNTHWLIIIFTEDGWDDTSAAVLEELVSGTILFTTVVSYTEDGVPLVNLYRRQQDQVRQSLWGSLE